MHYDASHNHANLQKTKSTIPFGTLWKELLSNSHGEITCRCALCGAKLYPGKSTLYTMGIIDAAITLPGIFWGWLISTRIASTLMQAIVILILALVVTNILAAAVEAAILIHMPWVETTYGENENTYRKMARKWYYKANAVSMIAVIGLFVIILLQIM